MPMRKPVNQSAQRSLTSKYTRLEIIGYGQDIPSVQQLVPLTIEVAKFVGEKGTHWGKESGHHHAAKALEFWQATADILRIASRKTGELDKRDTPPEGLTWDILFTLPVPTQRKLNRSPDSKPPAGVLRLTPIALLHLAQVDLTEAEYSPSKLAALIGIPRESLDELQERALDILAAWERSSDIAPASNSHLIATPFDRRPISWIKSNPCGIRTECATLSFDGKLLVVPTHEATNELVKGQNRRNWPKSEVLALRILRLFDPKQKKGSGRTSDEDTPSKTKPDRTGALTISTKKTNVGRGRPRGSSKALKDAATEPEGASMVHLPKKNNFSS